MNKEQMFHNDENYSYKGKIKNWRKYATRNKVPFDCEKCHKTHAYKTIYLDTGAHICWYCWIRKDNKFDNVIHKPLEIVKTEVVKKPQTKAKIVKTEVVKKPKLVKPKVIAKPKLVKNEDSLLKEKNIKKNVNLKLTPKFDNAHKVTIVKEKTNIVEENYYDNIKHRFYSAYSKKQNKKGDK